MKKFLPLLVPPLCLTSSAIRIALLALLFALPSASASKAPPPEELLAEAERVLLADPVRGISLAAEAARALPDEGLFTWRGKDLTAGQMRETVEMLHEMYAATENRPSFAAYCLDQLIGPDRMALAVELARRRVREGDPDAALSLAREEELIGEGKMRLLMTLADHYHATGESSRLEETVDEMLETYPALHPWVQGLVRVEIADRLVTSGRLLEVVPLAHEAGSWLQPYYLSQVAEIFPNWEAEMLMAQAVGLAQQQEPAKKSMALARLAAEFIAKGQEEFGQNLLESARRTASSLSGREKVLAFATLASIAAGHNRAEEVADHLDASLHTVLEEMEGWEQTDALIEAARLLAGTAAAPVAGPLIEEASARLSATAEDVAMRNKYRVYEFRGMAAAASPATDFAADERRDLFVELLRLHAMPDEEEGDPIDVEENESPV